MDKKYREFWLWNKNKAITLEESVYRFPNPNKEHIHVIEYSAYDKLANFCKCGGVIYADTEDWPCPMCYECYVFVTSERDAILKEADRLAESLDTFLCDGNISEIFLENALTDYRNFKKGLKPQKENI